MEDPTSRPPRAAQWLLERILLEEQRPEKMGDFLEGFKSELGRRGPHRVRSWYRKQVIRAIPVFFKNFVYWSMSMFKNYLMIAWRHIKRHKGYAFLTVFGLAAGMACCILILCWARDELATDRFHEKLDSIYFVRTHHHYGTETVESTGTVPALGPALKSENPEVLNAARFNNGQGEYVLAYGDRIFKEAIQFADPEIFEIFTLPFVKGDPKQAFSDPFVLVMAESVAAKYFGRENPIGKSVTLDGEYDFRVVGVMKDIPHNSILRFNVWAPLEFTRKVFRPNYPDTWFNLAFRTYVEMDKGFNLEAFNAKIFNRIRRSAPDTQVEPYLYPFSRVYLDVWERRGQVRVFSAIGLFILVIACINFMNLTTARSARRAREVSLRKVVGAQKSQVMRQFFGESILMTVISLAAAGIMAFLFMPAFSTLTGKPLEFSALLELPTLAGILAIVVFVGILAGSYPALALSAFQPAWVLKGSSVSGARGGLFRKALVVFQFALSGILIIGTAVIYLQVRYMKTKDLGFDKEHIVYIPIEGALKGNARAVKAELLRDPRIQSVCLTSHSPTGVYWNGQDWNWEGRNPNINPLVTNMQVDPDFLKTFKAELAHGEFFPPGSETSGDRVVINERFAAIMGRESPLAEMISNGPYKFRILGVVKDFHFTPVGQEIGPMVLFHNPAYRQIRYIFIRLNPGDVSQAIGLLEKTVLKYNPGFPFDYHFLDDDYDRLYRGTERLLAIVRTFAVLGILISCLGLFGLAAYTAEQRTREIGIRKVLGASVSGVVALLSREYVKWVLVANAVAWPVSFFLMESWLRNYHYRIRIGWPIFLLTAVLSMALAELTVGYQALRAARSKPVDTLHYE